MVWEYGIGFWANLVDIANPSNPSLGSFHPVIWAFLTRCAARTAAVASWPRACPSWVVLLMGPKILHHQGWWANPIIYRVWEPSQVVVWDFVHQQYVFQNFQGRWLFFSTLALLPFVAQRHSCWWKTQILRSPSPNHHSPGKCSSKPKMGSFRDGKSQNDDFCLKNIVRKLGHFGGNLFWGVTWFSVKYSIGGALSEIILSLYTTKL